MNVTNDRFKDRQLHIEDYLQMVSAESKEYAEVSACQRIAENNRIITDFQTDGLLEKILQPTNLNNAYKKVKSNKGAGGVDGMSVDELLPFLRDNQVKLIQQLKDGKYKPNPVRRVEIPKETKGEFRKLGVATVVDRVFQQAITQVLSPIYEEQFSENSFGFRPKRGVHDALKQCQQNVDDGYVYVVDMDLVALSSIVALFGTYQIAANGIAQSIWSLAALVCVTMGPVFITVIGQCMGAGDAEQAEYYFQKLLKATLLFSIVWNTAVFAVMPVIMPFFDVAPQTRSLTVWLVLIHNVFNCIAFPFADPLGKGLRAAGDVKFTAVWSLVTTIGVRLLASALLAILFNMGVIGIALAMSLDWCVRAVVFYIRFKSGKWKNHQLI